LIGLLVLSLLPSFEGRYALVLGILSGVDPALSMLIATFSVLFLSTILPLVFPKIDNLMVWMLKSRKRIPVKIASAYFWRIKNLRLKVKPYLSKYGIPSLIFFVALPVPSSGVWTGALLAYLFGMDKIKSFLTLLIGGVASNLITFTLVTLGFQLPLPEVWKLF